MGSCSSKRNFSTDVQKVVPNTPITKLADDEVAPPGVKGSESEPVAVSDQFSEGEDLEIQTFTLDQIQVGGSTVRRHCRSFSTVPHRTVSDIPEAGGEVAIATTAPILPIAPVVASPPLPPQPQSPLHARHRRFSSEIIYSKHKRKWSVSGIDDCPVDSWKFDFNSKPAASINDIKWENSRGVQKSEEGSQGVFFVDTGSGSVVVKGSTELAAEVFSSILARHLGIRSPDVRIVSKSTDEGQRIVSSFLTLVAKPGFYNRAVVTQFSRRYFAVMEFMKGITLENMQADEMSKKFGEGGHLLQGGKKMLRELGQLAAFDLLTNNSDRIPLLSHNEGNAGNLMLASNADEILSLDNCIVAIDPNRFPDNLENYLESVAALLSEMVDMPHKSHPQIQRVQNFVLRATGYDVGTEGCLAIQEGILSFVKKCETLSVELMISLKNSIASHGPDVMGLHLICIPYLDAILEVMKSKGSTNAKVAINNALRKHSMTSS